MVGFSCHHLHDVWFEMSPQLRLVFGTQLRLVFVPTATAGCRHTATAGCTQLRLVASVIAALGGSRPFQTALLLLSLRGDKGVWPSSARCLVGFSCHHLHDVWFEMSPLLSHGWYSIPLMMIPAQPRCWLVFAGSSSFCRGYLYACFDRGPGAYHTLRHCLDKIITFMVVVVAV